MQQLSRPPIAWISLWHPDFVPISFYKMFGYPTGIGCLLVRKAALAKLKRPWFSGSTVWGISVQGDGYVFLKGGEAFEDGTINYLSLPAVEIGLKHLSTIGIEIIHQRRSKTYIEFVYLLLNWSEMSLHVWSGTSFLR